MIGPSARARTCRQRPASDAAVPIHHQGLRVSAVSEAGIARTEGRYVSAAWRWAAPAVPSNAAATSAVAAAPTGEQRGPIRIRSPARRRAPAVRARSISRTTTAAGSAPAGQAGIGTAGA